MLADLGADLDKSTRDGASPAFIAAQEGHAAALEALGALGADLDRADEGACVHVCVHVCVFM